MKMIRIQELIKKYHFEVVKKDGVEGLKTTIRPTAEDIEEIKKNKIEIIAELKRQDEEEFYKMQLEDELEIKRALKREEERLKNSKKKTLKKVYPKYARIERFELNNGTTWSNGNVYAYGECIGTLNREEALKMRK